MGIDLMPLLDNLSQHISGGLLVLDNYQAIEAALQAHEMERAAFLIEQSDAEGRNYEVQTLHRWLSQLPETVLRVHPILCLYSAIALQFPSGGTPISSMMHNHVVSLLQVAEEGWRQQDQLSWLGMIDAFHAMHAWQQGQILQALKRRLLHSILEIQLLLSLTYIALQQEQKAHQWLQQTLTLAQSEGLLRLFLEEGEPLGRLLLQLIPTIHNTVLHTFAQTILQAFTISTEDRALLALSSSCSPGIPFQPLSMQEQRVLRLLVEGYSNGEIARELVVSINTIKDHVKHVYRKPGVRNRLQASEAARHLKLC